MPNRSIESLEDEMTDYRQPGTNLTRSELSIKNSIDSIKTECGELRDADEAVQCFSIANDFEDDMNGVIRGSVQGDSSV